MINIIYRLCELETDGNLRDIRPQWFNKINCLKTFLNAVVYAQENVGKLIFLHDGPEGPLLDYIMNVSKIKCEVLKIDCRDNLTSLITTFDIADQLEGDIYFIEDDYVHKIDSINKISLAVQNLGLVTGYDHLYRYIPINPPDIEYKKETIFDRRTNLHWRTTECTTCSWAVRSDVYDDIKDDARKFGLWDVGLFKELHNRGVHLWSPIPGLTTHVDEFMSPGVDWRKISFGIYD